MYKVYLFIEASQEKAENLKKIQREYQIPEPVTKEGIYLDMFGNLIMIEKEEKTK